MRADPGRCLHQPGPGGESWRTARKNAHRHGLRKMEVKGVAGGLFPSPREVKGPRVGEHATHKVLHKVNRPMKVRPRTRVPRSIPTKFGKWCGSAKWGCKLYDGPSCHGSVLTSEAATVHRSIGSQRSLLSRRALILALIIPMNEVLTGTHRAHRLQQNPVVVPEREIRVIQHRRTPLLCGRQDDRAVIPERLGRPPQSRRVLLHRREDDLAIPMRGPRSAYRIRSELDQLPISSHSRVDDLAVCAESACLAVCTESAAVV